MSIAAAPHPPAPCVPADAGEPLPADHIERLFVHHLQRLGVERLLDIGSNAGHFGGQLRRCGYAGLIYSIEPSACAHQQLLLNARDDLRWFALAPLGTAEAAHCLRTDALRRIEALKIDTWEQADEVIARYLPHIGSVRLLLLGTSRAPGGIDGSTRQRIERRLVEELGFERVSPEPSGEGVIYGRPMRSRTPASGPSGLRIAAVVTSIGGTLERCRPDGSDLGPLWLQQCVQSWGRIADRVVSVAERAPPAGLEWQRTETRPGIAQLLGALPVPADSHLLLTNADIVLTDALRELIARLHPDAVYYGNRVDVEYAGSAGLSVRGVYRVGFDYFLLPAAFVRVLIDERLLPDALRIGAPWWDYALPLLAVARGFALKRLPMAVPLALHYRHDTRYSHDLWLANLAVFVQLTAQLLQDASCCGATFLRQLLERQSDIPALLCGSLP